MIDRELKRCLGQMIKGVQVVSASHRGLVRAYCSHWITQVSFTEPIILASVSPKHDTHPLMIESGRFAVSLLAADQVEIGQYFSYPGRRFHRIAEELLEQAGARWWVVPNAIAWLGCSITEVLSGRFDHDLVLARVIEVGPGRLREPPLLYSSRLGWRATGLPARQPGSSVRDQLLARLAEAGLDSRGDEGEEGEEGEEDQR